MSPAEGQDRLQQQPRCLQQFSVAPTHDDPPERPTLVASHRRTVGVDYQAALRIDPQSKAIAPEPVYRNGDVDVLQERS